MERRGQFCVGIDPHPSLLDGWGLSDDAAGLERFALTVVEALAPYVAVLKPQSAFFERHGAKGIAVLERVIVESRAAGALVLLDVKRGTPMIETALTHGAGVFVLALTSNPEGPQVQHATTADGRSVAGVVLAEVAKRNAGASPIGSIGAVVGATIDGTGVDFAVNGPLLAPGVGAQGGTAADVRRIFGSAATNVLPSSSREILAAGPDKGSIRAAAERAAQEFAGLTGT